MNTPSNTSATATAAPKSRANLVKNALTGLFCAGLLLAGSASSYSFPASAADVSSLVVVDDAVDTGITAVTGGSSSNH